MIESAPLPSTTRHATGPSQTYAEAVYAALRDEIITGVHRPGDRLTEIDLAQRMRTSQGPVREALARLRAEGLVVSFAHRGTFVTEISVEEARDAYDVRAILERAALQRALPRMGVKEFAKLDKDVVAMERAAVAGKLTDNLGHDMRFHRQIFGWSGSPTLLQLWDVIEIKIRKFAFVATPAVFKDDPLAGVRSHGPLLKAMRAGYSKRLEAEIDRHLSLAWMTVEELQQLEPAGDRS